MKFGDKLYKLRRKNGFSQEKLGEKLNVTRQTISKWELGQSKPDTDKLIEISRLLNVDFNQLANDDITIQYDSANPNINSDDVHPRKWLLVVLVLIAIVIIIILLNKIVTDKKERDKNKESWGIFEIFDNFDFGNGDFEKKSFNNTFEFRIGTKSKNSVSNLIDDIVINNKTNSKHIISVVFDDINTSEPNEIKDLKKKLGTNWDEYEVSADYNEDGYIYIITIEKITDEETNREDKEENEIDAWDIKMFNTNYEIRSGTQPGSTVIWLIDEIITNNKTNKEHVINVTYKNINSSDENEIRNLKKALDVWTQYEVILDYNEIGFVSQVTIQN